METFLSGVMSWVTNNGTMYIFFEGSRLTLGFDERKLSSNRAALRWSNCTYVYKRMGSWHSEPGRWSGI